MSVDEIKDEIYRLLNVEINPEEEVIVPTEIIESIEITEPTHPISLNLIEFDLPIFSVVPKQESVGMSEKEAKNICFRCKEVGHWIQNCKTNGDDLWDISKYLKLEYRGYETAEEIQESIVEDYWYSLPPPPPPGPVPSDEEITKLTKVDDLDPHKLKYIREDIFTQYTRKLIHDSICIVEYERNGIWPPIVAPDHVEYALAVQAREFKRKFKLSRIFFGGEKPTCTCKRIKWTSKMRRNLGNHLGVRKWKRRIHK